MESVEIVKKIMAALDKHKAQDVKILKLEDVTVVTDYFVIAGGNSNTQVKALAGAIEEELKKDGIEVNHVEGHDSASWILLDYGGVIVHVFMPDAREFYNLERLWADAAEVQPDML